MAKAEDYKEISLAAQAWEIVKGPSDPAFENTERGFQEEKNHAAERVKVTRVASPDNAFEQAVLELVNHMKPEDGPSTLLNKAKVDAAKRQVDASKDARESKEAEKLREAAAGNSPDKPGFQTPEEKAKADKAAADKASADKAKADADAKAKEAADKAHKK
jgi:glucose-1-phosphatase